MAKLATEFVENTTPSPTSGVLLFDPTTGLRERLNVGQFFSRFGINVGVNAVNIPQLTGDLIVIGNLSADNLSGVNTGDQDISGIIDNRADILALQLSQAVQDEAIALNTAKRSYPEADETRLANTSGTNTGDQDVSGIGDNSQAIAALQAEQVVQDDAIALNTAKRSYPEADETQLAQNTSDITVIEGQQTNQDTQIASLQATQVTQDEDIAALQTSEGTQDTQIADLQAEQITQNDAIALNTAKRSYPLEDEERLASTSGTNTGDQDLSNYAVKDANNNFSAGQTINGNSAINAQSLEALSIRGASPAGSGSVLMRFKDSSGGAKGYIGYGATDRDTLYLFNQVTGQIQINSTEGNILNNIGGNKILQIGAEGIEVTGLAEISGNLILPNLPTTDPLVAGAVWNNAGVLNISTGAVTKD